MQTTTVAFLLVTIAIFETVLVNAQTSEQTKLIQALFTIVSFPNSSTPTPASPVSVPCPTTVNYSLITQYRNINPEQPGQVYDGILWDNLKVDGSDCLSIQSTITATYFTIPEQPPPGTQPDITQPWLIIGRDSSKLDCVAYQAKYTAQHFFTNDLPRYESYLIRIGFLQQGLVVSPFRGDVYLFWLFESQDGMVRDPTVCVFRAGPPLIQQFDDDDSISPSESPDSGSGPACLSGITPMQVISPDQKEVVVRRLSDIKVSDTLTDDDRVISFSHRDTNTVALFYAIHIRNTVNNRWDVIEVTGGHLMYMNDGFVKRGGDVVVGDSLLTLNETDTAVVTRVSRVERRGLYAPITKSGRMVVHGVVVSCYTDFVGVVPGHALGTPIRAVSLTFPYYYDYDWCCIIDVLRGLMSFFR